MRPKGLMLALAAPLLLGGCGDDPQPTLEDEVAQFAALTNVKPLVQACQELDKLCKSSGKGCKAHGLFCTGKGPGGLLGDAGMPALPKPPSPGQIKNKVKQMICSNLKQACAKLPLACKIYNKHCGQGAAADAGAAFPTPPLPGMPDLQLPKLPGMPDFQLPKLPGLDQAKCCAALDTCIKQNDATCAAANSACALPPMPGGGKMQMAMLKAAHKALCSSP